MLPPYELEKTEFRKSVKGYNVADVDEHIEFMIDKYTELYRAYNELEQKLAEAESELATFKSNEDAIRRALIYAQNTKKHIIDNANRRSERILASTREHCDEIITGFKEQIRIERGTLASLKAQVEDFKHSIFEQYHEHIRLLESISPDDVTGGEWILPESDYTGRVLTQVRLDVERSEIEEGTAEISEEDIDVSSNDSSLETLISDKEIFDVSDIKPDDPSDDDEGDKDSADSAGELDGDTLMFGIGGKPGDKDKNKQ